MASAVQYRPLLGPVADEAGECPLLTKRGHRKTPPPGTGDGEFCWGNRKTASWLSAPIVAQYRSGVSISQWHRHPGGQRVSPVSRALQNNVHDLAAIRS